MSLSKFGINIKIALNTKCKTTTNLVKTAYKNNYLLKNSDHTWLVTEFHDMDSFPTYVHPSSYALSMLYYKMYKISPFNGHTVGSKACHLIKKHEEFLKCVKKWPVREQANALVDIHCLLLVVSQLVYLKFMALFCCKAAG
jgi:hypothetical protein